MATALPRIEDRVIGELLEHIARETDGGGMVSSDTLTLPGRSREQIRRHLRLVRDEGLIHYTDAKDLDDAELMHIDGLTPAGWRWLEELRG